MSNKREPLLSDEQLDEICEVHPYSAQLYAKRSAIAVDAIHEAARAKDAELIQRLLNALEYVASYDNGCPLPTWEKGYNEAWAYANAARTEVEAAGFKVEDL
jgi:hypothetical protein